MTNFVGSRHVTILYFLNLETNLEDSAPTFKFRAALIGGSRLSGRGPHAKQLIL